MTANRKQAVVIAFAATLVLYVTGMLSAVGIGRGFGPMEGVVSLVALLPAILVGGLIWFGIEVISTLRRIESAVRDGNSIEPEFRS